MIPQKIGKGLLWTFVVFLILRGIGTLFTGDDGASAQEIIEKLGETESYKERVEYEASTFAEGFSYEYMTLTNKDGDYLKRLKKYIPTYLYSLADGYNRDYITKAQEAKAYKTDWIGDNQINVLVRVKVKYITYEKAEGEENKLIEKERISDVYIKVPVAEVGGRYIIEDYPAFVPEPKKAEVKYDYYSGSPVESDEAEKLKEVLENFFKTYYTGNSGEISYYMLDNVKLEGTKGRFKFKSLDEARSYLLDEKGENIFSLVILTIKDSMSGKEYKQRFNVSLTKKDNRIYIKDFDVRIGNLNK